MKPILEKLTNGVDLSVSEADEVLVALTDPEQDPALAGGILTALRTKGETSEEVRGFVGAMRRLALRPNLPQDIGAIDIVGTGGDGSGSLNLSTGSAMLTASMDVPVIKHGNRSITSRCGSADVLTALGAKPPKPDQVAQLFERSNFAFLFAPYFHPAMKNIAPIRKSLGVRTIFNILGPLTNPALPSFYFIGAFDADVAQIMADALSGLPIQRAFVVHGENGWDEATPIGPFTLWDVTPGKVTRQVRDPLDVAIERCTGSDLAGGDAEENASAIRAVFQGARGPHRNALVLGAGLAMEVTGQSKTLAEGIEAAASAIDSGKAHDWLHTLRMAASEMEGAVQHD